MAEEILSSKWPFIALMTISIGCLSHIGIRTTFNYHTKEDEVMYRERRPSLVVAMNTFLSTVMCVLLPAHMFIFQFLFPDNDWEIGIDIMLQFLIFLCVFWRIWHSFLDLRISHLICHVHWKSILDKKYRKWHHSFLIKHYHLLGIMTTLCFS